MKLYRNPYWPTWPLLQITQGCTHNSCKFCTMYKDVQFKLQPMEWIEEDLKELGLREISLGVDAMIDPDCKDKDLLELVTYISADERTEKVMENQSVIRQPIVRNGRQATVGYAPDVWKTWQ